MRTRNTYISFLKFLKRITKSSGTLVVNTKELRVKGNEKREREKKGGINSPKNRILKNCQSVLLLL